MIHKVKLVTCTVHVDDTVEIDRILEEGRYEYGMSP